MSKFNVGDVVCSVSGHSWDKEWNNVKVVKVDEVGVWGLQNGEGDEGLFNENQIELLSQSSPIREVTRKELVAGVYGRVQIDGVYGKTCNLLFLSGMGRPSGIYGFKAQELRDAARVFGEIADFLEEKNP